MSETVGYMVTTRSGPCVLAHYRDSPPGGILLHGDEATVFDTRHQARHAIERTQQYGERYNWPKDHRIFRAVRRK